MPLINYKIHLELNCIEDCILPSPADSKFKITSAKLHVPIVTQDNVNLTKQSSDRFKISLYWNNYITIPARVINQRTNIYELFSAWFQSVKRLFVLAYAIAANAANIEAAIKGNKKYFLPRGKVEKYNVLMEEIFMINQLMI